MKRWMALFLGGAAALAIGVACGGGGDDERTIDVGNGDEVTVGGDLPDDFPDNFPVYDGADLQGSVQGEQDGIEGYVVTWTTGDDLDDVTSFYEDAFSDGPWVQVLTGNAGGSSYWSVEEKDGDRAGYVAVSGGDEVSIIATVGDDPSAQTDSGSDDSGDDSSSDDGASSDGGDSSDDGSGDDGSSTSADLPDEVDLPDGFPTDLVSIPDSVRVTTSNSFSSNGQETFMVGFHTQDSAEEIGDYFKDELEGNGFTESVRTTDGNGVYAAYSENDDGSGAIIVISVADSSSIEGYREGVVQVTTG